MPAMSHKVAIVGCGTVGGATAQHLIEQHELIRSRYGGEIELAAVVDLSLDHARALGLPESVLSTSVDDTLAREDIDIVVELIGGTEYAGTLIKQALASGKDVVTANKALLAHRGPELFAAARAAGKTLAFEASCGGGIPVIRAITDGLAGNRIDAIYGIVNGTCNYILSQMIERGLTYEEALGEAQADGLAEADPTLDVSGMDSAHKIAVMAALAFGVQIDFDAIPVTGIDSLGLDDVTWAERLGYMPKLLAIAERSGDGIGLAVQPAFVTDDHPLSWVGGPFNAVSIYSYPTGHTLYYGRGAGGSATAGAIVADLISVATGSYASLMENAQFWPDQTTPVAQNESFPGTRRYYIRMLLEDKPGALAEITNRFGQHGISFASVHQDETDDEAISVAPVVAITHRSSHTELEQAVAEIDSLSSVHQPCVVIPIIDEPKEALLS
jgi:homoserine dehydrogenase